MKGDAIMSRNTRHEWRLLLVGIEAAALEEHFRSNRSLVVRNGLGLDGLGAGLKDRELVVGATGRGGWLGWKLVVECADGSKWGGA